MILLPAFNHKKVTFSSFAQCAVTSIIKVQARGAQRHLEEGLEHVLTTFYPVSTHVMFRPLPTMHYLWSFSGAEAEGGGARRAVRHLPDGARERRDLACAERPQPQELLARRGGNRLGHTAGRHPEVKATATPILMQSSIFFRFSLLVGKPGVNARPDCPR